MLAIAYILALMSRSYQVPKVSIIILLLSILSCSTNPADTSSDNIGSNAIRQYEAKPLQIISEEEDGFGADIRLSFIQSDKTDTSTIYKVVSIYQNKEVGFDINVPNEGLARLSIKSVGAISNNFLHALQKMYNQRVDTTSKFVTSINCTCISMGNYVDSLKKLSSGNYATVAQNKVFIEGKSEDDYAELYFNISEAEHWIELREKDEEYRPVILKLFREK